MITLLITKLPWLAGALSFFRNKTRLVIEYALIIAIVAVASLTFTLWLSKERTEKSLLTTQNELTTAQGRLTIIESISQQQEHKIRELKELRSKDARALTGLLTDHKILVGNDAQARRRLSTLERSNETIRSYLNQCIPHELACVLNSTCNAGDQDSDKGGASNPSGGAGATVPASPEPGTGTDKRPR